MPTNLAIDDRLIEEARQIGHHGTKKETVTATLDEYIRRRKQMLILDLFGTVDLPRRLRQQSEPPPDRERMVELLVDLRLVTRARSQPLVSALMNRSSRRSWFRPFHDGRVAILG